MNFKKCAAALAALALSLCTFAGCGGQQSYTSVLTVNDSPVSPGLYRLFQLQAYTEAAQSVASSDTLFSQTISGKSAVDWIADRTADLLRTYFYYETEFAANGLSFTDEEKAEADLLIAQDWEKVSALYERNAITETDFYAYDLNVFKAKKLFLATYADISDDEIRHFLNENFARMNYVQLPLITSAGTLLPAEDAAFVDFAVSDALKSIAQGAGFAETITQLITDCYTKAGFTVSGTGTGYIRTSYLQLTDTAADAAPTLASTVCATAEGACGSFKVEGYYYVVFRRQPNYTGEAEFASLRSSVLYQMKSGEFSEKMKPVCESYEIIIDAAAASYYSPKKLDLSSGSLSSSAAQ